MKEISHLLGRVAVLVPPAEILPFTGWFAPKAFTDIAQRYSFQTTPNLTIPVEQIQKDGFKFQFGKVAGEDGKDLPITEFNIFHDGFVVNATRTEDAERFLSDLLSWGKKHFGLRDPVRQPRRLFASQVEV